MCRSEKLPFEVSLRKEWLPTIQEAIQFSKTVPINRDFDIPYLAGYSNDGQTVYIDRHMPKGFEFNGKLFLTDRLLAVHECVEKALQSRFQLHYYDSSANGPGAHKVATDEEFYEAKRRGIPWEQYNDFCNKYVKQIGHENIVRCPYDLDLQPYQDEHDEKDLRHIYEAMTM